MDDEVDAPMFVLTLTQADDGRVVVTGNHRGSSGPALDVGLDIIRGLQMMDLDVRRVTWQQRGQ
jgi:hypothetical protein